jgi:hypothetical protein
VRRAAIAVAAVFLAGLAVPADITAPGAAARAVPARELAARLPASPSRGLLAGSAPSWTAIKAPVPNASLRTLLWQVGCHTAALCVATGIYGDSAGEHLLLLTGHGSSWIATKAPLPAGAGSSSGDYLPTVNSVACPSASGCVAAGYYQDTSARQYGLLLTGHGTSWTATKAPLPAGAAANPETILSDVACPSATECIAVGYYFDAAGDQQGLLVTGHGSSWTATKAPMPPGDIAGGTVLKDVACPTAVTCVATGSYLSRAGGQGLLLTGHGTSWKAARAPLPSGAAAGGSLGDVACPAAAACVATGSYLDPAGHQDALAGRCRRQPPGHRLRGGLPDYYSLRRDQRIHQLIRQAATAHAGRPRIFVDSYQSAAGGDDRHRHHQPRPFLLRPGLPDHHDVHRDRRLQ